MGMKRILLFVGVGVAALLVVVGVSVGTVYMARDILGVPQSSAGGPVGGAAVQVTKDNVLALKPFVTNLADSDRPRYISVTFELVLGDPGDKSAVEANLPLIRDQIVAVLSTKRSQEVTGEAGANTLKNDILKRLADQLGSKHVQKVLITDLVVQY